MYQPCITDMYFFFNLKACRIPGRSFYCVPCVEHPISELFTTKCTTIYGAQRIKTCLQCFRQSETQTSLLKKGTDQFARMSRLVWAFVVPKPPKTGFLMVNVLKFQTLFSFRFQQNVGYQGLNLQNACQNT